MIGHLIIIIILFILAGNNLKPNDKDTGIQVGPSGNSNQKIPGGINVNSGYPGGVNVNFPGSPGGGINVNSDFGGGINTNPCFNGGKFVREIKKKNSFKK